MCRILRRVAWGSAHPAGSGQKAAVPCLCHSRLQHTEPGPWLLRQGQLPHPGPALWGHISANCSPSLELWLVSWLFLCQQFFHSLSSIACRCVYVEVYHPVCLCISGVLGAIDQECVSQREAERYVVKMDQSAQARIDNLIQEAHCNSYTLYILVHDHAHWDINRCVFGVCERENEREIKSDAEWLLCSLVIVLSGLQPQQQQEHQQSNQKSFLCLWVFVSFSRSVHPAVAQTAVWVWWTSCWTLDRSEMLQTS